jgi:hypothetical protein
MQKQRGSTVGSIVPGLVPMQIVLNVCGLDYLAVPVLY